MLSGLAVTHKKNHIEKSKSHKRKKKDTNHCTYAIQQKTAHVGLSAPHDGAQLKNADIAVPGSMYGGKDCTSGRGSNGFGGVIRPADGELLKQCSFSKSKKGVG